jgi:hypothetical protein
LAGDLPCLRSIASWLDDLASVTRTRLTPFPAGVVAETRTTFAYDSATGELLGQSYSDTTPAVTFTYDRLGRNLTTGDVTGTRNFVYDAAKPWRFAAEAESDFYGQRVFTNLYDETTVHGRPLGFELGPTSGSASDLSQSYAYLAYGRFSDRGKRGHVLTLDKTPASAGRQRSQRP